MVLCFVLSIYVCHIQSSLDKKRVQNVGQNMFDHLRASDKKITIILSIFFNVIFPSTDIYVNASFWTLNRSKIDIFIFCTVCLMECRIGPIYSILVLLHANEVVGYSSGI